MAKLGLDYPTAWGRQAVARGVRRVVLGGVILPWTRRATSMTMLGVSNIPTTGPLLFTANHTSHLDTPLALAAIPPPLRRRTVVAGAVDTFFMKASKAFVTVLTFNVIPIERHKVNRRSAEQTLALLNEGWNVLIYPEGGRTTTGSLMEFKGGAAYLAERSGAPVVPTFLAGAGDWRGAQYAKAEVYLARPNKKQSHVTVAFGKPLHCGEGENIRAFNVRIQQAVIELGRATLGDPSYASDLNASND